jgi:hypothetical protein
LAPPPLWTSTSAVAAGIWRAAAAGNAKTLAAADTVKASRLLGKGWHSMTIVVLVIVALVIVIGLGYLIVFRLMKGGQTVIPEVADERAAKADRVVAVDDQGRPVTESQDMPEEPRPDEAGFEKVLVESLDDLHPDSER